MWRIHIHISYGLLKAVERKKRPILSRIFHSNIHFYLKDTVVKGSK